MQKVLITGADGFIGSHLTEFLVEQGYEVKALVQYNSFNSWGWLDSIPQDTKNSIEVISGDVRDFNCIKETMKDVDIVFHLAALIAIPYSYNAPFSYVDTNISGTLNILQAARELETEKTLITSTSEVYGTAQFVPITEDHPKQGQSPYSASKISADCLAESYYRSFDLPVTIVRPFNTYGPRQSARAIIPTIITQLLSGCETIELGDLSPTRDLVYVKDTIKGFVEIAKANNIEGQAINIATGKEISIERLANELISQINPNAHIVCDTKRIRPKKSEVFRLLGDNKKLKTITDWTPEIELAEGIRNTIEWFSDSNNLSFYKTGMYTL